MSEPLLELRGISKRFGSAVALHNVSLTLLQGEILAVVGENGAGKSTLMKILSGVHQPDSGAILLNGQECLLRDPQDARQRGISIIYQEFSLVPQLNVVENLFLGRELTNALGATRWTKMEEEARLVLDRLGAEIELSWRVEQLSIAQQQFVEIAKALLGGETRVLIMDEPTATLSEEDSRRLLNVIRDLARHCVSVIFISHHLDEVFDIANRIVCLRDGQSVGTRDSGDLERAELIRMMVGRDLPPALIRGQKRSHHSIALDVRAIQRKPNLPTNSFQIREGEILGVAGLVGSGRTKMIRGLLGVDRAHRRDMWLHGKRLHVRSATDALQAGIGFVPEDRKTQGLVPGVSVRDNMLLASFKKMCHPVWRYIQPRKTRQATQRQIEQLGIKTSSSDLAVRHLSGGNQQKVVLGKWLVAECSVLILDEPTRGIDVGAKAEIYDLLRRLCDQGLALLLISSEINEVIRVSDRVMVMRDQQIVHTFESMELATEETIMDFAAGGTSA